MYVEKRKLKGKVKYYLSHSFREGGKIHKIRKLLGSDLSKDILEDRKKKAEKLILEEIEKYKIIRDPLGEELSKEEVGFIKRLEKEANLKVAHLSEKEWKVFSKLFTYNTNAIEGSNLTNTEVEGIIEEDRWPKEKSKADIAEAYGVDEAISFIRDTKDELSVDLIRKIHKIVFRNSKDFAGEFRKKGEEVVVQSASGHIVHEGAPQTRVIPLLKELVEWYTKYRKRYTGLILAAVVHNQFENIHPFADGNGRIGRILLNNILLKNELPPINIELKHSAEYYATLSEYSKNKNIRPTIVFLLKEYRNTRKSLKN